MECYKNIKEYINLYSFIIPNNKTGTPERPTIASI